MTAPLTPGAYLKARRTAALLSIADVAAHIGTEPRVAERLRAEQLEMIEADIQPASFPTIVVLRAIFPFDLAVLEQLVRIQLGSDLPAPRLCRICACSDHEACVGDFGQTCWWVEEDRCVACAPGRDGHEFFAPDDISAGGRSAAA